MFLLSFVRFLCTAVKNQVSMAVDVIPNAQKTVKITSVISKTEIVLHVHLDGLELFAKQNVEKGGMV